MGGEGGLEIRKGANFEGYECKGEWERGGCGCGMGAGCNVISSTTTSSSSTSSDLYVYLF